MELLAIGLNHQSASLALREKLAFPGEVLVKALADAKKSLDPLAPELALLSTCNRTELYLAGIKADKIIFEAQMQTKILPKLGFTVRDIKLRAKNILYFLQIKIYACIFVRVSIDKN